MKIERKSIPNMLLFGAAGRNLGKTELAVRMIESYAQVRPVSAIKVVTVHDHGDICPRGGKGCGICKGLKSCFDIHEEHGDGEKDTMRFGKAGAENVFLVRAFPEGLAEAMEAVCRLIPKGHVVVCESNSVAEVVKPGAFFMITDEKNDWKPSALAVRAYVDELVESGEKSFAQILKLYGSTGEMSVK